MAIKLYGFPISNFYNKVKYALLFKGIEFEEVRIDPKSEDPNWKRISPNAKIPVLEEDGFVISESLAIAEYLEDRFPEPQLFGSSPKERAQIRELILLMDNYIDSPARLCYDFAFRGKEPKASLVDHAFVNTQKGFNALRQRATFDKFLLSESITFADMTAFVHIRLATETFVKLSKPDLLQGWEEMRQYLEMIDSLEISKKVSSARRAALRARAMGERAKG